MNGVIGRRHKVIVAGLTVIAAALTVTVVVLRGRGYRGLAMAILRSPTVSRGGDFRNIIFLHHSVGRDLIERGGVRELFAEQGYDLWDHDYNGIGVTGASGTSAGFHYRVPNDNTNPDGLARIFEQRSYDLPVNTLSGLLQHEVIAFKSCFPASNIASAEQLEEYRDHYRGIRDVMERHPDRVFIVITPPPLNPVATDAEAAGRARAFADWLTSAEYLSGHPNVFTFNLFGLLAEDDASSPDYGMLREDYRNGSDSHPNRAADEAIGPQFVDFIVDTVGAYRGMQRRTTND